MSQEQLIQLLVGGAIGLITGLVTSIVNRKFLIDELAAGDIILMYVEIYNQLAAKVQSLTTKALRLIAQVVTIAQDQQGRGKTEVEIREAVNAEFRPKSVEILEEVSTLRRYYVLLPLPVIEAINSYEDAVWSILRNATPDTLKRSKQIQDASDYLIDQIRTTTAQVITRDKTLGELLYETPAQSYAPMYLRKVLDSLDKHSAQDTNS
jgi:hypothetical protein